MASHRLAIGPSTYSACKRREENVLTRRAVLVGLGAVYAADQAWIAPKPTNQVDFKVPPGACDAHVHVIGKSEEFPMSSARDYTPPAATVDELRSVLQFLGIERVIIVTPDLYGTDNSATLAAIRTLGEDRARGVAWIDGNTPTEVLDSMTTQGIVGLRVSLYDGKNLNPSIAAQHLQTMFGLAQKRAWHLQFSVPPFVVAALASQLASSPVPLVFTYFGWAQGGVDQPGFSALLSLVKSGLAYVKLSEPYRLSNKGPTYPDLQPAVGALLAANSDRILWGSGWPHLSGPAPRRPVRDITPDLPIDAGDLLNLFAAWVPDLETRRKILVDNPARLYGF
jgi:predicted TIM-barrel fold metal-dependent hydrolase